jgi:hypothetical protein
LSKNKDVFAWSALDLVGVSRSIIEHSLGIDPSVRPKKQRLRKMSDEKTEAAKAEVHRLLEAKFIESVAYPTWLANVVMVQKKNDKWRMCIDFTSLNKACPKDNFPLPRIDKIVDSAAGCEVMSLLDCFSGYHQIYMKEKDKAGTSFITPFGMYCFIRMPEGLKNVGSTFSRLTRTVLESQVGRNIREHARRTTSPKPRKVRLRRSRGEDTGIPGVAPRNRSQPDQNTGHHQHDAPAVSQRCPTTDRQIGRPQQIHLQIRRAKPTFPQNATREST